MAAVVLAVLVAASACGQQSHGTAASSASPSTAGSYQRFASCMRSHGQNVPDQDPNSGNVTLGPPAGGDRAGWDAAMRTCQRYLPGGAQGDAPDAQQLDAQRAYAACMRDHGIEMSDPDPATGKSQFQGRLANLSKDQINKDPTFRAAQTACQDKLDAPASKRPGGTK